MKANRLSWFLVLLLASAVLQLPAQQSEANGKLLADIRAKAEQGDAGSQWALGSAFRLGKLGLKTDEGQAVKWYRKAAEQNYAAAQLNLGLCYAEGRGVTKDEAEAVGWFRKAAEQKLAEAQYNLGVCYSAGRGVLKDETEAVKWFRKAADQNYAVAQFNLSVCYEQGLGVAKDEAEAVNWLRKAAEHNFAIAQAKLGFLYDKGLGVPQDYPEAVKWFRKAAEQNEPSAQNNLGSCYTSGRGVEKNAVEAVKWYRKAAEQNLAAGQRNMGSCYARGEGVPKDAAEAVKWFRKAAEQNDAKAQGLLGNCYYGGDGVTKDYVEAYKWMLLAAAQGNESAKEFATLLEGLMTHEQVADGQKLARAFTPREVPPLSNEGLGVQIAQLRPESSGTGFFITEDGFLITNEHVVGAGAQVRLVTEAGLITAKVVKVDAANDLALLKTEGKFGTLPVVASRTAKMGSTVATVGFPNIGLQGFAPKLAKGEIAALSGAQDDPRYFQISVPVQPGNSGGALVDERGNVVGVVAAKLSVAAALATSGALPENVNYAVKSSFLLGFLESVPEVSAKLKEAGTKERKFEDVVKDAEQAAVLVLVY